MDPKVIYNTPNIIPLGVPIAFYFYLTGLSAGSFVISVVSTVLGKVEYKPIGKISAVLAPLLLVLAPTTLVVDLEQPFRFWHLFVYLNMQSPITYGSFLLTLYPINGIVYAWFLFSGRQTLAKIFGLISVPIALATHGYTGFILALGKGRALWSTALMPTLFIVSAMLSGIALVILLASLKYKFIDYTKPHEEREKQKGLLISLGKYMGVFIAVDLFLIFNDILVLLTSSQEAYQVAKMILWGSFSHEFVGVELFLGGIVPLFLVFLPKTGKSLKWINIAAFLVMLGVLSMRIVVVVGGQAIPLH